MATPFDSIEGGAGDTRIPISDAPATSTPFTRTYRDKEPGFVGRGIDFLLGSRESRHPEFAKIARDEREAEAAARVHQEIARRVSEGMTPQGALVDFIKSPQGADMFAMDAGSLMKGVEAFVKGISPESKVLGPGSTLVESDRISGKTTPKFQAPDPVGVPIKNQYGEQVGIAVVDRSTHMVISSTRPDLAPPGQKFPGMPETGTPGQPGAPGAPAPAQQGAHPLIQRNNPGAILAVPGAEKAYPGVTGTWTNPKNGYSYLVFDTPESGQRAIAQTLGRFGTRPLIETISMYAKGKSFTQLAEGEKAEVQNYANFVAKSMGVAPNTVVNFRDPGVAQKAIPAIMRWEMGQSPGAIVPTQGTTGVPGAPGATVTPSGTKGTPMVPTRVQAPAGPQQESGFKPLWPQIPLSTGIIPGTISAAQRITGQFNVDVLPKEVSQARLAFRDASNGLIRATALNPRFIGAEQERIRKEFSFEPGFFVDERTLADRLIYMDGNATNWINQLNREWTDERTPMERKKEIANAIQAFRHFKERLGVPPEGSDERANPPRSTFREQVQMGKEAVGAVKKGVGRAKREATGPEQPDLPRMSLDELGSQPNLTPDQKARIDALRKQGR